jgi:small-conductance mechanosensitive channel
VQLELRVWVLVDAYLEARTTLIEAVRRRLDAERVVIPFPHRTLHGAPEPLAVRLVGPSEPPGG